MIGSFFTRGLVLIFGYAYPAYECYKSVELNKPDIEQLRFWCQYWVLVALMTVCERVGDVFIGWVPMYGEAKLAFFIYLWFPKTKGTKYVYESFFRPYIAKHETDIDRNLLELRTRAGDMAFLYWQMAAAYIQTRTFDIFQFIAAQSTPKKPAQPPPKAKSTIVEKPTAPKLAQDGESSSASSISSSDHDEEEEEEEKEEEAGPSIDSKAAALKEQKSTPTEAVVVSSKKASSSSEEVIEMQIDSAPPVVNETVKEIVMKESGRMGPNLEKGGRLTRARSRKKPAA